MLKVFKLERMDGIEKLKEKSPKELKLDKLDIKRDPFGYLIEGKELKYLDLRMDLKAFILFSLHFSKLVPRIEKFEDADNSMPYRIELELLRVDPLAGWLFGLLSHVEIVGSSDFKESLLKFYQNNLIQMMLVQLQNQTFP
jgi:hypothetical protein